MQLMLKKCVKNFKNISLASKYDEVFSTFLRILHATSFLNEIVTDYLRRKKIIWPDFIKK